MAALHLGTGFDTSGIRRVDPDFNCIPAHVWPRTAKREADGTVAIGGIRLPDLAAEFGTPVFVLDEEDFRSRCRDMARAFGGADRVHYASKAFLCGEVARWVADEGLHLDVASANEMAIAMRAGFNPANMTFHGNNKSEAELEAAVQAGIGLIVLDSFQEIERLDAIAAAADHVQDVLVRVKPGVEAHTHEFIATAHEDQKFGFSIAAGSADRAVVQVEDAWNLTLRGLHCHIGSQIFDVGGFSIAARRVLEVVDRVVNQFGAGISEHFNILDLGGGFGIAYTADEKPLDVDSLADDILAEVAEHASALGIPMPTVVVEPGRAIVGPSMVTVYTVGTVKDVHVGDDQTRRYLAVDGGMSDNIRTSLYQAEYDGRVVNRQTTGQKMPTRLVGKHCESGDILINDAQWPDDIRDNDLVALAATGAYCYAMSSRYNMLTRPPVVAVKDGTARVILRRETLDDLLSLECD